MIDKRNAQSILYSYRYLFRTCDLIDNMVNNYVTNFGIAFDNSDTETLSNKIIDLIQRKKYLINLKLYIDKVISLTDGIIQKVLVLMSQYNYDIKKVQKAFNVCERTAFRYMKKALEVFVSVANRVKGIDLDELRRNDSWIFNLHKTYACSRCMN